MTKESVTVSVLIGFIVLTLEKPEAVLACNANGSSSYASECNCSSGTIDCDDVATLSIHSYLERSGSECAVNLGTTLWNCEGIAAPPISASLRRSYSGPLDLCGGGTDSCEGSLWTVQNTPREVSVTISCGPSNGFEIFIQLDEDCAEGETDPCMQSEKLLMFSVVCPE